MNKEELMKCGYPSCYESEFTYRIGETLHHVDDDCYGEDDVERLAERILEEAESGEEQFVNETLIFGTGVYMEKDCVGEDVKGFPSHNSLYYYLEDAKENIERALRHLFQMDGYLIVQC